MALRRGSQSQNYAERSLPSRPPQRSPCQIDLTRLAELLVVTTQNSKLPGTLRLGPALGPGPAPFTKRVRSWAGFTPLGSQIGRFVVCIGVPQRDEREGALPPFGSHRPLAVRLISRHHAHREYRPPASQDYAHPTADVVLVGGHGRTSYVRWSKIQRDCCCRVGTRQQLSSGDYGG